MWVLKFHGETYYVNHVDCTVPWSTKETPDNSHTKGSIKVKNCLIQIDDDNCATISVLTKEAEIRIRNNKLGITRIVFSEYSYREIINVLHTSNIKHGPIKSFGGNCSTTYYVTDILKQSDVTFLILKTSGVRVLKSNEAYYKMYDSDEYDEDLDYEELYESSDEE